MVDLNTSVASTSFTVQLGRNDVENKDVYMRYWDFEKWMRKECLNSSVSCAMKFGKKRQNEDQPSFFLDSSSSPLRMRLLKILLSVVEASPPQEAPQPFWTKRYKKFWGSKLADSSSTEDILQMLTTLECDVLICGLWLMLAGSGQSKGC
ncbi:hypothetical protein KIW84_022804 [Lathyrus oleraceus]|uniref:Uncharacterized protein n=1 Tax=Pisum sativum TaxID=3888 RepID=A0A9D4YBD1_PEA|nr:hypothetical protein KIW84_022804 [Pisum sativum]